MLIRKPLYMMAEGDGSEAAGESGGGGSAPEGKGEQQSSEKTFTQADVDRIIAGRLAKFSDYDTVKQQLSEIQAANQTESERAVEAAKDEGRKAAASEFGKRLALAEFNNLAGRRNPDYDAAPALELIDLGRFVKDDGDLDADAIKAAVDRIVPERQDPKPAPSFGGGPRRSDRPEPSPGLGRLRNAYESSAK